MSTQTTLSNYRYKRELGFLSVLSLERNWVYVERAVSVEPQEIGDRALKAGAFKISAKSLKDFLEKEEEGSIF